VSADCLIHHAGDFRGVPSVKLDYPLSDLISGEGPDMAKHAADFAVVFNDLEFIH
jgi:hypothetical protein